MVVVKVQGEMLIDRKTEAGSKIERILRPCSFIFIMMIINAGGRTDPRSQAVDQSQPGSPRLGSCYACRGGRFESIAAHPAQRVVAAYVINHTFQVGTGHTPIVFQRAK